MEGIDDDDDDVTTGELFGTGHDGRSGVGQSGLCQAADRERSQYPSLPDDSSSGGAVQHGEMSLTARSCSSVSVKVSGIETSSRGSDQ